MIILVADTSVIIDLERGNLLEVALTGPDVLATPDFLYEAELKDFGGPNLLQQGLQVITMSEAEMTAVQAEHTASNLGLADCAAIVATRRPYHELLTGDQRLRSYSERQGLTCHGLLWFLDRIEGHSRHVIATLHAGNAGDLSTLAYRNNLGHNPDMRQRILDACLDLDCDAKEAAMQPVSPPLLSEC